MSSCTSTLVSWPVSAESSSPQEACVVGIDALDSWRATDLIMQKTDLSTQPIPAPRLSNGRVCLKWDAYPMNAAAYLLRVRDAFTTNLGVAFNATLYLDVKPDIFPLTNGNEAKKITSEVACLRAAAKSEVTASTAAATVSSSADEETATSSVAPARAHSGRVLSLLTKWGHYFQHCVLDALPKVEHSLSLLDDSVHRDVRIMHQGGWHEQVLRRLGYGDRLLRSVSIGVSEFANKPFQSADELITLWWQGERAHDNVGLLPAGCLDATRAKLFTFPPPEKRRDVVYFRRVGNQKRSVANEDALFNALSKLLRDDYSLKVFDAPAVKDKSQTALAVAFDCELLAPPCTACVFVFVCVYV
jgi:hypothetical protein